MDKDNVDRRKLSGDRVLAECEIVLPVSKTFSYISHNVKTGYVVLNIRARRAYDHITETHALSQEQTQHNFE